MRSGGRDLPYLIDSADQSAGFWSRRNHLDRNFLAGSYRATPSTTPLRPLARAPNSTTYRLIFYNRRYARADTSETVYSVYTLPSTPHHTADTQTYPAPRSRPVSVIPFRLFSYCSRSRSQTGGVKPVDHLRRLVCETMTYRESAAKNINSRYCLFFPTPCQKLPLRSSLTLPPPSTNFVIRAVAAVPVHDGRKI